ncbi:serine protease inhibitor [Lipingzhangella halophila]|uniref:Serine protease inhibitor n=1 Tax=Lipingzhangella halophila TaxID=1783352 RepID=A0A7W7RMU1_9ACTN|nr:serpin family protein [Lipingzhangella halophila]MBB4934885.1 serine protease inhibitor [Lipingzhangella halophila]
MTGEAVRAANTLTARWVAAEGTSTDTSTALSGAGLWPLLALLAAAADGAGRRELAAAAGVDTDGAERHACELLDLVAASASTRAALGVWARADLLIDPWWRDTVPSTAQGELAGDTATDQARLDEWVRRHTDGRLTRMPISVDPDTLLVLATALSIRTRWRTPFDDVAHLPKDGPWAARERPISALRRSTGDLDQLAVAATSSGAVTLVTVEGEDDLDVHLLVGKAGRAPNDVVTAGIETFNGRHRVRRGADLLKARRVRGAPGVELRQVAAFSPEPVLTVTTTRFTVSAQHDLLERAELFGLAAVSTLAAHGHFPRISEFPLGIGQARQDATADFSAEGFTAAAVTTAGAFPMGGSAGTAYELSVRIDRPFGFLATHRPSGLVLLAGWVAEPRDWPDARAAAW